MSRKPYPDSRRILQSFDDAVSAFFRTVFRVHVLKDPKFSHLVHDIRGPVNELIDLSQEAIVAGRRLGACPITLARLIRDILQSCWKVYDKCRDVGAKDNEKNALALMAAIKEQGQLREDLMAIVLDDPANKDLPRGRRGAPGYSESREVLRYARQLRENGKTVRGIRLECMEKFPDKDMPEDDDSFRKWLKYKHKR
jgi:hypothetical protein